MVVRQRRRPVAHQTHSRIEASEEGLLLVPLPRQLMRFQPAHAQRLRLPPVENIPHQRWR